MRFKTTLALSEKLQQQPETVAFNDVIDLIDRLYDYTPVQFANGDLVNDAGQNQGSCKILAFASELGLSQESTLHCFGHYYRDEVLCFPEGQDHANIRQFMRFGWNGVTFKTFPLTLKETPVVE